ncbi:MAG: hypothetical protein K9H16_01150 [Bacteroidales bacterium]|nr:hypothetical protein [Bacteroidales bacterium]
MSIDEFMSMSKPERVHRVLTGGNELMYRIYLHYTIKLFYFSDFFVEIWYLPSSNKIDNIRIVEMDDVMHLYDKEIDITDLFK